MVVDKSLLNTGQTEESLKALCLEFISSLKVPMKTDLFQKMSISKVSEQKYSF